MSAYDLNSTPMAFIQSARKNCRNTINNTAAGLYLESALKRLELREDMIAAIRGYVGDVIGLAAKNDDKGALMVAMTVLGMLDKSEHREGGQP